MGRQEIDLEVVKGLRDPKTRRRYFCFDNRALHFFILRIDYTYEIWLSQVSVVSV